jgi:ABC-type sugar transport system substrate-binding protein
MKPRALVALAGLTAVLLVVASGTAEGRSRLRIGLVFQDTAVTGAYQQGAFAGLQRAVKELGVEAKTVVPGPRQNSSFRASRILRGRSATRRRSRAGALATTTTS